MRGERSFDCVRFADFAQDDNSLAATLGMTTPSATPLPPPYPIHLDQPVVTLPAAAHDQVIGADGEEAAVNR